MGYFTCLISVIKLIKLSWVQYHMAESHSLNRPYVYCTGTYIRAYRNHEKKIFFTQRSHFYQYLKCTYTHEGVRWVPVFTCICTVPTVLLRVHRWGDNNLIISIIATALRIYSGMSFWETGLWRAISYCPIKFGSFWRLYFKPFRLFQEP